MMIQKGTLVKSFKWSSIGTIGVALFQLLQIVILTRFLPKEVFGLVALAVLVVNFTNIFVEMGVSSAILHVQNASKKEYNSLYWLTFFVAIVLYLVIFIFSSFFANYYDESELVMIIRVLGLNVVFITLGQQYRTLLQKEMKFAIISQIALISCITGLISATILAYLGFGIYSLIYSTLINSLLSSILFIYRSNNVYPLRLHFKFQETKKFLNVGIYSLGSNILDFFSRESDVLIIGKVLSPSALGVYSLIKQISLKLYSVLMPIIFNVLNPFLASMNEQKVKMEATFLVIVYRVVNITFPFYLIVILAAKEIITLLYGIQYAHAYKVLVFMSIFQACFSIVKPLGSLQIATGKTNIGFYWTILRNALTIFLLIFLVKIGFESLDAISLGLALLSLLLISLTWKLQVSRMTNIKSCMYFNQFYKQVFILLFICFLKLQVLDIYIVFNSIILNGVFKVVIGLFLYFVFVILIDKKHLVQNFKFIFNGKG